VPGMNSGLNVSNPTITAAFRSALLHQGIIALLVFTVLALAWVGIREWIPATRSASLARPRTAEPTGRMVLRVGFGIIWVFDGILQAQPAMAVGLPSQVIEPTAKASPTWVQHLVNWAGTTWSYHPIQAGAAAVWIQVGIGVWLLAGARGPSSRLAGVASVAWGLIVWVFGEAFGGIFAPGLTWLFGAPGAALIYCAAGALVALPERAWLTPQLGRRVLAAMGAFFAGMAVLQAWPGRGFWQGTLHGKPGSLTGMITSMATTPQPRLIASWVSGFAVFVAGHGFAVNLVAVVGLAVIGAALLSGQPRLLGPAVLVTVVFCLADWVLIEDLGFFGGLGTDPNSMIPIALVVVGGYLAMTRLPKPAAEPAVAAVPGVGAKAAADRVPATVGAAAVGAATAAKAAVPTAASVATTGLRAAAGSEGAADGADKADPLHSSADTPTTDAPAASAGTPAADAPAGADTPAETPASGAGTRVPDTPAAGAGKPVPDAPAAGADTPTETPVAGAGKPVPDAPAASAGTPVPDAPAAGADAPTPGTADTSAPGSADTLGQRGDAPGPGWRERLRPSRLAREYGAASTAAVVAIWAVAVILIGAAPMALAQANPNADPIIAQAIGGTAPPLHFKAPAFSLTSQDGRTVSLASLRGKVVLLTFLDPVCTNDCPLIAQEFKEADQVLGANAGRVELVAIVTNPLYHAVAYTRAFDAQEGMSGLPNWLYLTGSVTQLRHAWGSYGVAAQILPAGAMIAHSDVTYVIDGRGEVREELDSDPGPGTQVTKSSFATLLADAADKAMG
jgi:cytochrome oxidase Cu insertion factor (SCO1/SenC/PrrC family)